MEIANKNIILFKKKEVKNSLMMISVHPSGHRGRVCSGQMCHPEITNSHSVN